MDDTPPILASLTPRPWDSISSVRYEVVQEGTSRFIGVLSERVAEAKKADDTQLKQELISEINMWMRTRSTLESGTSEVEEIIERCAHITYHGTADE
ncbi:hypothetical protein ACFXKD_00325 [Nocardiopsis aegyptia]|uniref:hypothetical protein n=1 Tax=Nocardiopsis aegyptia TaxID=220378 RepID=UPI00366B8A36